MDQLSGKYVCTRTQFTYNFRGRLSHHWKETHEEDGWNDVNFTVNLFSGKLESTDSF